MTHRATPVINRWHVEPPPKEVEQALARLLRSRDVQHVAVMPDVHLAADVCNGVAVGTTETLYPDAVGGDIGCGMAALSFDGSAAKLEDEHVAARLLTSLYQVVPSNKHGPASVASELPSLLRETALSDPRLERIKAREGRLQLGTLGRGNHFVEFQRCEQGRLWLMVHSGSRAIGQAIRGHHLHHARRDSVLPYLLADSPDGQAYVHDHDWAVAYADENRRAIAERTAQMVFEILGIDPLWDSFTQSNHNHVRRELHGGRWLWVHRKGALPAHEGVPGVIPGSMGTVSYHVTGRGDSASLCCSSHGAGRRWSRSEARRKVSAERLEDELADVYFDHRIARQLRDEAPSAYKDIDKVMRAQRDLTRIERRLWPVLCYKGV